MWTCEKCGDWRWNDVKKCHCKEFHIIDEDGETHEVYAMDEEDAARKYAEASDCDCDNYLLEAGDDGVEISVNGKPFRIHAEPDVNYYATELTEE